MKGGRGERVACVTLFRHYADGVGKRGLVSPHYLIPREERRKKRKDTAGGKKKGRGTVT